MGARWATLIDDEVLNTFAVVGEPEQVAPELHRRYGDVIQRITLLRPLQGPTPSAGAGARRASKPADVRRRSTGAIGTRPSAAAGSLARPCAGLPG